MKKDDSEVFFYRVTRFQCAAIAQLGERKTEDLEVPGSIPGGGKILIFYFLVIPQ